MDSEKAKKLERKREKKRKRAEENCNDDLAPETDDLRTDVSHSETSTQGGQKKKNKKKRKNDASNDAITNVDTLNDEDVPKYMKKQMSKRQLKKQKLIDGEMKKKELLEQETLKKMNRYIDAWKNRKSSWKFEKLKQIWLIDNIMHKFQVSDKIFPDVLEYFIFSRGMACKILVQKALKVLQKVYNTEDSDVRQQLEKTVIFKRAQEIVNNLPDDRFFTNGRDKN